MSPLTLDEVLTLDYGRKIYDIDTCNHGGSDLYADECKQPTEGEVNFVWAAGVDAEEVRAVDGEVSVRGRVLVNCKLFISILRCSFS